MKYLLIISTFYLFMTQCQDQKMEPGECTTEARVMKLNLDGCDLILQLNDGRRLNPVEVVPDFELKDGQRLKISYTEVDMMTVCMVGQTVRVDCIENITPAIKCQQEGKMIALKPGEDIPSATGFSIYAI